MTRWADKSEYDKEREALYWNLAIWPFLIAGLVVGLTTGPVWLAYPLLAIPALCIAGYFVYLAGCLVVGIISAFTE